MPTAGSAAGGCERMNVCMSVSMTPGRSEIARDAVRRRCSAAIARVSISRPAFAAQYSAAPAIVRTAAPDDTLTMRRSPAAVGERATERVGERRRRGEVQRRATRAMSHRASAPTTPTGPAIAALLTRHDRGRPRRRERQRTRAPRCASSAVDVREIARDECVASARERRARSTGRARARRQPRARQRGGERRAEPARHAGDDDARASAGSPMCASSHSPCSDATMTSTTITASTSSATFHGLFGYSPAIAPVTPFITHWNAARAVRVRQQPDRREDVLERLRATSRRRTSEIAIRVARHLLRRTAPAASPSIASRARCGGARPGRSGSARPPSRRRSPGRTA